MNLPTFIILLTVCAAITSLLTEAVKTFLDMQKIKYASNIVVLVLALITGCAGAMIYYYIFSVPFTPLNCIMAVFLGLANWVGAMVGYDKVKQALEQIKGIGGVSNGSKSTGK